MQPRKLRLNSTAARRLDTSGCARKGEPENSQSNRAGAMLSTAGGQARLSRPVRVTLLALSLLLPVALVSCGGSNPVTVGTPAPPNSAQAQVANFVTTLKDANSAAVHTAVALRDQGKLDAATVNKIEDMALLVIALQNKLADELGSGDSWTTQKIKLSSILGQFALARVTSDPGLSSAFAQVVALIQQITTQVNL